MTYYIHLPACLPWSNRRFDLHVQLYHGVWLPIGVLTCSICSLRFLPPVTATTSCCCFWWLWFVAAYCVTNTPSHLFGVVVALTNAHTVGDPFCFFLFVFRQYGQWEHALDTLRKLVADKPPMHSLMWGYNAAISALGKAKQLEGVKDLLASMKASGALLAFPPCLVSVVFGRFVGFPYDMIWLLLQGGKGTAAPLLAGSVKHSCGTVWSDICMTLRRPLARVLVVLGEAVVWWQPFAGAPVKSSRQKQYQSQKWEWEVDVDGRKDERL